MPALAPPQWWAGPPGLAPVARSRSSTSAPREDCPGRATSSADPGDGVAAAGLELPAGYQPVGDLTTPAGIDELIRGPTGMRKVDPRDASKRCTGCGAWFHSNDPGEHGYVPADVREKYGISGRRKEKKEPMGVPVDWVPDGVEVLQNTSIKYKVRTRLLVCERCYRLQNYHRMDTPVAGGFYRMEDGREWEHEAEIVEKVVRRMRKGSLVLMVIDVLDFESSLVPSLFDACRNRRFPVIFIINKVDCLPYGRKDKGEIGLDRVKTWVRRMSRQIRNVKANDVILVSARNAYGFGQLEERLRHYMEPLDPRWLYVVGRANSGKSTFVNRFLWYVGYKHQGTVQYKRTVGGVTRSPVPGTTLHFMSFALPKGFRLVDTPGIPSRNQITSHLQEAIDLYAVVPGQRLIPITYVLHMGRSLFAGALVRVDQVKGALSFVSCFFRTEVTLHVCQTKRAEGLLERKAGTFFYPPHSPEACAAVGPLVRHRVEVFGSSERAWDDIVIAGMGWVAISGYGTKELDVWVPKGVRVFRRPSLLPQEMRNRGVTRFHVNHRARTGKIHRKKQGLVKARRDKELRDRLREEQARVEEDNAAPVEVPEGTAFVEDGVELSGEYFLESAAEDEGDGDAGAGQHRAPPAPPW